ncbi:hypothetical protein VKT23_012441 [Stygiomarasmius scandens]|uniref:Uncharacterized protein n=1 Tax=Marasmiellus scandens TaxID=2682957 RepID=A0ABR1J8P1_9AGAR
MKGLEVEGSFEVFDSKGSWQLLFGKPLLQRFQAIHEYKNDTIHISMGPESRTVFNDVLGLQVLEKLPTAATVEEVEDEEVGLGTTGQEALLPKELRPEGMKLCRDKQGAMPEVEVIENQSIDNACNLSGVPADTDIPLDREVNALPFADMEEVPTDNVPTVDRSQSTKYSFVFETPAELLARWKAENEEQLKWI